MKLRSNRKRDGLGRPHGEVVTLPPRKPKLMRGNVRMRICWRCGHNYYRHALDSKCWEKVARTEDGLCGCPGFSIASIRVAPITILVPLEETGADG